MTRYLVDTNVISELTKPVPSSAVISWLRRADPDYLFASVVTFGELRIGIESLPQGKRRVGLESWLQNGLPNWFDRNLLPVTKQIADTWGRMTIDARGKGRALTTTDGLIAATALEHDLTVVTRNVKDFTGLGIDILDPWVPIL